MIRVGILTYNKPHLKTQQVIRGLVKKKNIYIKKIIISKFKKFAERRVLFKHRPLQFKGQHPEVIAKSLKIKIESINSKYCFSGLDYVIICGSQIIRKKIKKKFIINCHSGLIPQSRGLDCFKWDILLGKKVGTTLHFIDNQVDHGDIISHKYTKIKYSDTLIKAANNHYNNEIKMLINFDLYLKKKKLFKFSKRKNTLRMSLNKEKQMIKNFTKWKKINLKNEKI